MNTQYDADIVISPEFGGDCRVWQNDKPIAFGNAEAARLIAAGASASKLSVYDVESACFLSGTVAQLDA